MLIRDVINGDISLSPAEQRVVQSKPFRRMRYIKQLGFAEYVYPCATHTRYEHSLGVMQCITNMYKAICKNSPDFYREGDLELLRMMALVHDFGHAPFSHASEELTDKEHEVWLTEILETIKDDIIIPNVYGIESWKLVNEVYQGFGNVYLSDKHLMLLHNLLDGFIDADKLDYLERDAYYCGVRYGNFDRGDLVKNLCIIGDDVGIRMDGINALESFILARYYMFSKVYTRPEERLMRKLYVEEMKEILPQGVYPNKVKQYLNLDDTKYVHRLKMLQENPYTLLYDGAFDSGLANRVMNVLGDYVVCDTVFKNLFREEGSDANIMVHDTISDRVFPCTDISPILKGIEFMALHKLRFYVHKDIGSEVRDSFWKVVRNYYGE